VSSLRNRALRFGTTAVLINLFYTGFYTGTELEGVLIRKKKSAASSFQVNRMVISTTFVYKRAARVLLCRVALRHVS